MVSFPQDYLELMAAKHHLSQNETVVLLIWFGESLEPIGEVSQQRAIVRNKEIARAIGIKEDNLYKRMESIYRKFDIQGKPKQRKEPLLRRRLIEEYETLHQEQSLEFPTVRQRGNLEFSHREIDVLRAEVQACRVRISNLENSSKSFLEQHLDVIEMLEEMEEKLLMREESSQMLLQLLGQNISKIIEREAAKSEKFTEHEITRLFIGSIKKFVHGVRGDLPEHSAGSQESTDSIDSI